MPDVQPLLAQAKKLLKTDKKKAREILIQVVDIDTHNEEAWLYMSGVVSTVEEQIIALENVLAINPNNALARKGLETIQQKSGKTGKLTTEAASPPPAPPPATDDPWSNLGGFGSSDPFGSAGSFDEVMGSPDPWGSPAGSGSANPPDDNPWGSSIADPWASPVASPAESAPFNPWGSPAPTPPVSDNPWESSTSAFQPDDSMPADPFARDVVPEVTPPAIEVDDEFTFDEIGGVSAEDDFSFVDPFADDDASDVFGSVSDDVSSLPFVDPFIEEKPRRGTLSPVSRYYSEIPDEMKLPARNTSRRMVILIGVLGFLNIVALVGIILAMGG